VNQSPQESAASPYGPAEGPIGHHIPEEVQPGLRTLLAHSADPAAARRRLEAFCDANPSEIQHLSNIPFGLQSLIAIFSTSNFLSEEVLQHPRWLLAILESGLLHRARSAAEMEAELEDWLGGGESVPSPLRLAEFRRRQLLRILLRDVLGFAGLTEIVEELSDLAAALIDTVYRRLKADLVVRHGVPRLPGGRECGFSILGLGKLGGRELNYSSDIDLMFLYEGNGESDGESPLTNKEFYKKISTRLTELLGTYTAEGQIYRIDLRLRPEGRLGEVCISLEGAQAYYANRARDWELQMLIKARTVAGDPEPGSSFLEWVQPMIYSTTLDFSAIEVMSETRERINERLRSRRQQPGIDVKLTSGGIRDIEFLVQCLQRLHGGRMSWLRNASTLLALARLHDRKLLSDSEYSALSSAYQFLRHLEHRLQLAEDRQTHLLPARPDEQALVARRMPPSLLRGEPGAGNLLRTLNEHLEMVQEIYQRVVRAQQPLSYSSAPVSQDSAASPDPVLPALTVEAGEPAPSLHRFLGETAPNFAAAIARARLGKSWTAFEHFLERILKREDWIRALDQDAALASYLLDIFRHSPYFAEQLMRTPDYFNELRALRERTASTTAWGEIMPMLDDAHEVRRYYLRQMFRLQAESICLSTGVFDTLRRASELADAAIAACYRIAVQQILASQPPSRAGYEPGSQMTAVALGRLGMQEFDLGSDADLVFIIPDEDLPELHFWTRVAEKLIAILASYTGDGTMFAVDTRLVPNGRSGALVQSEGAYLDYFSHRAEAWEGITYLKSRAVAGSVERTTRFLEELQKIDWRRYGRGGRSKKDLRQMRLRLEKEQGSGNPLKTAPGGYYDIDFALLFLRLKGAGIFYTVLNTPRRIEIVEHMGHLDSSDARFLLDAATFYRAVDHGLRLMSGHTAGSLPASESGLQILTELVQRWVPPHLCDQPLPDELLQIQHRTRDFFDRLFDSP
jgi:glutamate-ammonia-ligase adenylyltransferase